MSSPAIRFGTLEFITMQGEVEVTETETIHDYETTNRVVRSTSTFFASNRKQMLAEMLKLTDKLNDDDISGVAFTCDKSNKKSPFKISVSWTNK